MTEQVSAPESDISDPAPVTSDKADDHRVPLTRLNEEVAKRRALEEQVAHMADTMLAAIPENLKALIPDLSPAAKVAWYLKAKETGVFGQVSPVVPETDSTRPTVTPRTQDISTLPPISKIAAGYRK